MTKKQYHNHQIKRYQVAALTFLGVALIFSTVSYAVVNFKFDFINPHPHMMAGHAGHASILPHKQLETKKSEPEINNTAKLEKIIITDKPSGVHRAVFSNNPETVYHSVLISGAEKGQKVSAQVFYLGQKVEGEAKEGFAVRSDSKELAGQIDPEVVTFQLPRSGRSWQLKGQYKVSFSLDNGSNLESYFEIK